LVAFTLLKIMVLNSGNNLGHVAILDFVKNRGQIWLMWAQSRLCCNFGNIKNCYASAQIEVTNLYLKLWLSKLILLEVTIGNFDI